MTTWPNPDEAALGAEVRRLLERSASREDVRAAPDSARAQHELAWKQLATQLGAAGLAVPEELGGAGADVGALAVVAQEIGRAAAAVPFLSTVLAADVLAQAADAEVLPQIAAGELAAALAAPLDGSGSGVSAADGTITGTVRAVLDGAAAELFVVPAKGADGPGLYLVRADAPGVTRRPLRTLDLGRPQATMDFDGAAATRLPIDEAGAAMRRTTRLGLVLLAAEQCGMAAYSLEVAVDYAKTREQFGAPIGSFQAIKHLCAGLYAQSELANALLGSAVELMRATPDRADTRVAVNAALVGGNEAASAVTAGTIQVLGGIGFTWEHDAHLYFRRARSNAVLGGGTAKRKDSLAEMLIAGKGLAEPAPELGPEALEFGERVRAFLAEHTHPISSARSEDGHVAKGKAFRKALSAAGLTGVTVPVEYGGLGLSMEHDNAASLAARNTEIYEDLFGIGTGMCTPVLLTLGTPEQKAQYLPPLLKGEEIWCQLFSEPGSGSDLASLRTKAVLDGDEYVVTGQKVWTTYAHQSDYALLLARTDPDVPKHKGITMFVVDMKAPGITPRPLRQITGDSEFNEVFLDEVRIPTANIVGALNGGWQAALVMLMNERVLIGRDPLTMSPPVAFAKFRELVVADGLGEDAVVRGRLADVFVMERSLQLLGLKIGATLKPGEDPGPYASISKLGAAMLAKLTTEVAFETAGARAAAWDPDDADGPVWAYSVLFAPALALAGGTDQIQRTIIGERLLGLPRG